MDEQFQIIEVEGVGPVEFPISMSDEQITAAVRKLYVEANPDSAVAAFDQSRTRQGDYLKETASNILPDLKEQGSAIGNLVFNTLPSAASELGQSIGGRMREIVGLNPNYPQGTPNIDTLTGLVPGIIQHFKDYGDPEKRALQVREHPVGTVLDVAGVVSGVRAGTPGIVKRAANAPLRVPRPSAETMKAGASALKDVVTGQVGYRTLGKVGKATGIVDDGATAAKAKSEPPPPHEPTAPGYDQFMPNSSKTAPAAVQRLQQDFLRRNPEFAPAGAETASRGVPYQAPTEAVPVGVDRFMPNQSAGVRVSEPESVLTLPPEEFPIERFMPNTSASAPVPGVVSTRVPFRATDPAGPPNPNAGGRLAQTSRQTPEIVAQEALEAVRTAVPDEVMLPGADTGTATSTQGHRMHDAYMNNANPGVKKAEPPKKTESTPQQPPPTQTPGSKSKSAKHSENDLRVYARAIKDGMTDEQAVAEMLRQRAERHAQKYQAAKDAKAERETQAARNAELQRQTAEDPFLTALRSRKTR